MKHFSKSLILISLLLFISACQSVPEVTEEPQIFSPENFSLVGFWKIEQKFLLDEGGNESIEVPVPRERYKEFTEWGENCPVGKEFFDSLNITLGKKTYIGNGSMTTYPSLSMIPSPALPSGFIPGGVCYAHQVEETPDGGTIRSLWEMSLQGVAYNMVKIFQGEEAVYQIKEFGHYYNFSENQLEMVTNYLEKEGNVYLKVARTILVPSTREEAVQDDWPYYNSS